MQTTVHQGFRFEDEPAPKPGKPEFVPPDKRESPPATPPSEPPARPPQKPEYPPQHEPPTQPPQQPGF